MAIDYLFGDRALIHDVVEHVRSELMDDLQPLTAEDLRDESYEETRAGLIRKFRMELPELDQDNIRELPQGEVDIDVSREVNYAPIYQPRMQNRRASATASTFRVRWNRSCAEDPKVERLT